MTTDKKGEKAIIVQCMDAIYGTMVDILIYYSKFVNTLKMNGFQLNPYYPCVANFMFNDKQKTVIFHVENCKLSHQDSEVND